MQAVEEMIATLKDLRQRTGDRALLGAYQAAIDRLDALAYRLGEVGAKPALPRRRFPRPRRRKPRCGSVPS